MCTLSIVLIDNMRRRDLLKLGAAGAMALALPRAAWAGAPVTASRARAVPSVVPIRGSARDVLN